MKACLCILCPALIILPLSLLRVVDAHGQEHTLDGNTLLLLHLNQSLVGAAGEAPTQSSGAAYAAGVFGSAVDLTSGVQLQYDAAGNIEASSGTLEFWFQPHWNGNDGQTHTVFAWGGGGGMLVAKDGANNWRIIVNRFGGSGHPEQGTAYNVASWTAEAWHHCAFTWSSTEVRLYVDGALLSRSPVGFALPAVSSATFQIGAEGAGSHALGAVDEWRISSVVRLDAEILDSFLRGLTITSLDVTPEPITLLQTWRITPTVTANTNLGTLSIPSLALNWTVANPAIAKVDSVGRVVGLSAGTTNVIGALNGAADTVVVNVTAPVLPPQVDAVPPWLATPMANALYDMPVAVIRYFPTLDGVNLEAARAGLSGTLASARERTDTFDRRVKFMLEEGSRFRGYANPAAPPSLGYRIVAMVTAYEPLPRGKSLGGGSYYPDYVQILERFDARHWVEDLGVKEIWLWGYHNSEIAPAESNMSSPTTGDVSNSLRFEDDLPICDRTYVLYNYNYARTQAEAVHNHGHQLEAILAYACGRQDGNTDLFWKRFVGQDGSGHFITGRCGWTHMPPNTTSDYDYENPTSVNSDIREWNPDGGPTAPVNAMTWGSIPYAWGENTSQIPQRVESQWYIYWMQSMPGYGNAIVSGGERMTNWWLLTSDWDAAMAAGYGLHRLNTAEAALKSAQNVDLRTWPNPTSSGMSLEYVLPVSERVAIDLFDITGRHVRTLDRGLRSEGRHQITWPGEEANGHRVMPGVHYVVLTRQDGSRRVTRIVTLR